MDAFKSVEIERMRLGGNEGWRKFYEQHESTSGNIRWDEGTDPDRYTSDVGEEWKERLTCKVEGKEYVPSEKKPAPVKSTSSFKSQPRSGTPLSGTASRSHSPGQGGGAGAGPGGKVKVDDQYFARLGADNASRPDNLHPSQGGKYGGFGNTPGPAAQSQGNLMSFDDVQKDPMAALTKGFGWFTTTVSKTAKNVNDGFIQPAAKNFGDTDFAKQAQLTAAQLAKQAQQAGKSASDGFNRFVEGNESQRSPGLDESRRGFWDDFSNLADQKQQTNSSIGTSAMGVGKRSGPAAPQLKKQDDAWDDW
jgi:ADP-ribosylation factor GTPase-activating protein 1